MQIRTIIIVYYFNVNTCIHFSFYNVVVTFHSIVSISTYFPLSYLNLILFLLLVAPEQFLRIGRIALSPGAALIRGALALTVAVSRGASGRVVAGADAGADAAAIAIVAIAHHLRPHHPLLEVVMVLVCHGFASDCDGCWGV